jgi:hypothetical protein
MGADLHLQAGVRQFTLLGCLAVTRIPKKTGDSIVFSRSVVAIGLLFVTLAASAAAQVLQGPDRSIYILLGAGVLALVALRRRAS